MLCCKCAAYNAMAAAIAIKLQHLMDEKKTESVAQQPAAVAARAATTVPHSSSRLSSQSNSIDLIRDGKTNKKNILRSAFSLHDSSHARQSTKGKKTK